MKKQQFAKLAMMGLATGAVIASQASLSADLPKNESTRTYAHGCGAGKCGSKPTPSSPTTNNSPSNANNLTADSYKPSNPENNNPTQKPQDPNAKYQGQQNNYQPRSNHGCGNQNQR